MATSKTLTPTNVTIQIPAFTDKPDQRVNSNCIDKEADAINALSDQIANLGTDKTLQIVPLGNQTNGFRALIVNLPIKYTGKTVTVSSVKKTGSQTEYLSDFTLNTGLVNGYFSLTTTSSDHTTLGALYTITYSIT